MSNYCLGCGGVIGRDCFNPRECEEISINDRIDNTRKINQIQQALKNINKLTQELTKRIDKIEKEI